MDNHTHRCPWCSERCSCADGEGDDAYAGECMHDCDAIDQDEEYTADDISEEGGPVHDCPRCGETCFCEADRDCEHDCAKMLRVPDEFDDDGTCDFSDGDVVQ
jgi:hypothetical protein